MSDKQILDKLQNLGFSEKESRVYLASLKLGSAPIQKIAKLSGVNRATTYVLVEGFMEQGLMSSYIQGKKRFFTLESPKAILAIIHNEKAKIQAKEEIIQEIIPTLAKVYDTTQGGGQKPQVKFYEGKLGLNAVREEMLKTKEKKIYSIFNLEASQGVFTQEESEAFHRKRLSKKIHSEAIYSSQKGDILSDSPRSKASYKYIDKSKYNSPIDISIFDNNITITSFQDPMMSVLIQNQNIATAFKQILALIEEASKK